MEYETHFKLYTKEDEEFEAKLHEISEYDWFDYYDDAYQIDAKWYDHDKNMRQLSELYPDKLFKLEGEGEENEDIWEAYYKNGKGIKYYAKMSFPEFNEGDLK
jgi:hypothetical protein